MSASTDVKDLLKPEYEDLVTARQWQVLQAIDKHGGQKAAAQALGLATNAVHEQYHAAKKKLARAGHAPGHWDFGVPAGYRVGKVTRQIRNEDGTFSWPRFSPDVVSLEAIMDRCEARLKDFPRLKATKPPSAASAPLTNFLGLFDLHIGEKISSDDPAGRWDVATAKAVIVGSAVHALRNAPKAKRLVICFGGDAMHYDGLSPITPTSKHVLHSDGDFGDMVDATLDVAFAVIGEGLRTHNEVHLIWATGNHDLASSHMIRKMLAHIYAGEPRLSVVQSKLDYYALRFGKVMIGVHHGHGAKLLDYAGIFASMFRQMWGEAEYAYAHRGHEHHIHEKEKGGMIATQHPSLAPSDDYALGKGLISRRGCMTITYHDDLGEVSRTTTRPEMLCLPLAA
jgi:hypothetical protein